MRMLFITTLRSRIPAACSSASRYVTPDWILTSPCLARRVHPFPLWPTWRLTMPKYLFEVDYSVEGTKGLIKDGGSKRRAVVDKAVSGLGGRLEAFYYTYGTRDAIVIADLPDDASALSISLTVSASGSVTFKTTRLILPEEIDQAVKKTV